MLTRFIPSPPDSSFEVGPLTFHFYALCIIVGIAIAIWLGDKRLRAHDPNLTSVVADVAIFAVPSGIIGGRIYHVLSSPSDFFGSSGTFLDIFAIWKGGLGIWGAISLGALEVPAAKRPSALRALETFHPTFLYEAIWCSLLAFALILLSKKFLQGQVFAIYIAAYCLGRFFIESIRIDSANLFFGLRQNEWVSITVGVLALACFLRIRQKHKSLG